MIDKCTIILFISSVVILSRAAVVPNEEGELLFLNIIFRHGARTTYRFYSNDPYKNEKFFPYGLGGLTNVGKLQEYNLGKYLRKLYSDYLGEDYTENKVYVRSTDASRTQSSAQLVMAGLFPPSELITWNTHLLWNPVPINYKPSDQEDLFHRYANCPYKQNVLKDLRNNPDAYKKFMKKYEELYSYLAENSGDLMKTPQDVVELYFILSTEYELNLTLPEWTKRIFPEELINAAREVYGYFNYNNEVRKINSGYLLKEILLDSERKINGTIVPMERKLKLYSGHESTMGLMLNALGFDIKEIPPYGSSIMFELRVKNNEHFIKVKYYRNKGEKDPVDLTIPGCTTLCPLETIKSLYAKLLPTLSIEEACKQSYTKFSEF